MKVRHRHPGPGFESQLEKQNHNSEEESLFFHSSFRLIVFSFGPIAAIFEEVNTIKFLPYPCHCSLHNLVPKQLSFAVDISI